MILIASTFRVEIRHSDAAPNASEAATALIKRDEATGAGRQAKPAAPGDRIMVQFLDLSRANHLRSVGTITRDCGGRPRRSWRNRGRANGVPAILSSYTHSSQRFARQTLAATLGASTTSGPPGCQSIVTKPAVSSTRCSQVRMAGKVERSKSQRSATWV